MALGERLSAAGRLVGRSPRRGASVIAAPPAPDPSVPVGAGEAIASMARADLQRRRDELAVQVAEMHWDLGGLVYEMAIRDHFRLDVVVRRAAALQQGDAELAEAERLLRMEETGSAGGCPNCGALHSRGAAFCWQCGSALMEHAPSSAVTSVMDQVDTGL